MKFQNGDADVISDPNKDNYGLDIFVDVDGTGNKVRIPELCRREEVCKECSDINVEEMKDLINMKQVDSQIAFDKKMTLLVSVLGSVIGAGCVVFSIAAFEFLEPTCARWQYRSLRGTSQGKLHRNRAGAHVFLSGFSPPRAWVSHG